MKSFTHVENRYLAVASPELERTTRYLMYRILEVWPTAQIYGPANDPDTYSYRCACVPNQIRVYATEQDVEVADLATSVFFEVKVAPDCIKFSYTNQDVGKTAVQHLIGDPIWGPDWADLVSQEKPAKAKRLAVVPNLPTTSAEAK